MKALRCPYDCTNICLITNKHCRIQDRCRQMISDWQKSSLLDPVVFRINYQLSINKSMKLGFFGLYTFYDSRIVHSSLISLKYSGEKQHVL